MTDKLAQAAPTRAHLVAKKAQEVSHQPSAQCKTDVKQNPEAPNAQTQKNNGLSFQLKVNRLTLTQLELYDYEYDAFNSQMSTILEQAPHFFDQTPVVITLDKVRNTDKKIDFIEIAEMCQEYGIFPIAIRGGSEEMQLAALVAGLPHIAVQKARAKDDDGQAEDQQKVTAEQTTLDPEIRPSKIVSKPVRSGQQIYASGGDLILLAPVSTGAEVLADGNIHVYAPLRGRALAGIRGNKNAHIFCHQMEAELLSVAGHYKMSDDLQGKYWGGAVHAQLSGQHLIVSNIGTS